MKFDFKKIDSLFSTKSKTIILVSFIMLLLSLFFIYLRYADEKRFLQEKQNFYIGKVQNIYIESKKSTDNFFINRAYANLDSYGIKLALSHQDAHDLEKLSQPRWRILKKEHPSLQSMAFYDTNFRLLSVLGNAQSSTMDGKRSDKKEARSGFCYSGDFLVYKIIVPALNEKSETIGYLVLSIEPAFFLNEIKKLIGFSGYIIYQNKILDNQLVKHEHYDAALLTEFLARNDEMLDRITQEGRYFKIHKIKEHDFSSNKIFNIIFFQDITQEQVQLKEAIVESFFIASFLWIVILVILNYSFNILIKRLEESHQELVYKEEKLAQLNLNLESRVAEEIEERMKKEYEVHEKERMLIHQSKLANMGEMIGNIAHQWRQPLTELSAILIAIELFFERGKLSAQKLSEKIEAAQKQISFMSHTIEDFRNFFASGKQKKIYNLEEPVKEALNLIYSSLHNNHIEVALHVDAPIMIEGYANEIAQAILNILSNAKDILIERATSHPKIMITIQEHHAKGSITIEDNAGGIHIEPIEKIFEPYFSTKHAKSGTGIGLYMCKSIIEKNNRGELNVTNTEEGAVFTIILDKSL
ncbi:MAG: ATP-binding protein [Sulfurospirillaceae bacterium]|nr:ATP-binding protein [Sulfurospirillaceae bacterium]MDD2827283.1 ATP-binding protein [Sulfurospirillaceae bacterium]